MNKSRLRLVFHDSSWKEDFAAEKQRILSVVKDSVRQIEHVGSTSIPGIYAKPILDIAVLCRDNNPEAVAAGLVRLGYDYRGRYDEKAGHFYAVLDNGNIRLCQAHIYAEANADWFAKLRFRDVLRQNAELAREYSDYKLRLAKTAADKTEYAEIKTKWVDAFILKVWQAAGNLRQTSEERETTNVS